MFCAALPLALSACTGASHIPPPWEIPGAVIGTTIGNARYEARRKKVKTYLTLHYALILDEISRGQGAHINEACRLGNVPPDQFNIVTTEIAAHPDIYLSGPPEQNIERMTVAIMVHGN